MSNTLVSNIRLKLAKNPAKAKQHPRLNFCYLKIIPTLHLLPSKTNTRYSKKCAKKKQVSVLMRLHDYNENEAGNEK